VTRAGPIQIVTKTGLIRGRQN